ncbi:ABC transporter substrate-binding protein [Deinococcus yavapaiensis]|uniref:Amino acid/amide ABC transporter substrate-binding protein (HAAT family) n=1 Tax=Deinococcus yavapaiensis KR-236 TaxID=694435 RepID=A0A318S5Y3_9DEIO|nr:ABC transporter substrate-binding protein [Deinococcus yavapaiensis]PYE51804.1 amino acid/amide ABC transporter substrate-binding protein (HAAT family) [Deinococcus yavapaiensis KR-236]
MMKKSALTVSVLVALTSGLLSTANAVKVGVLLPLSGTGSVSGQAAQNGYKLALSEINKKGGVLGKPLEVVFEDDQSTPAKAVPAFVKLVTVDKVDFMAGGVSSATTIALSGPAKQYNTFMAWIGAAAVPVEDAFADAPYFFHYHPWAYYNVAAVADFYKHLRLKNGAKTIAIAYEDGPFGSSGIADLVKLFEGTGLKVVATEKFKSGSGSFGALVTKVKAANPDILHWIGYDVDALPLATELKQQGVKLGMLYGTPPSWPVGFEKNRVADDVAGLSMWVPSSPVLASKDFVAKYKKMFGSVTEEYFAPLAYVNLISLANAINKAGSADKDKVAAELAKTNMSTPFGKLTFSKSNKIKYQGFKGENWLHFQFLNDERVPVYPKRAAKAPIVYSK